ncbi:hypothetical protein RHGRI_034680 [Rhododendron griersonianum]|uniref:Uncharacterized protein n=1 Tax=Rhododendron griersonianum TaxID=479676 RepID=A0AAV6I787_9ERIC|nr:hypothetical protein RHGRI_034680 [Rhododendron griersonianum]
MITSKKAANAVGGKTARACDSCLRNRARWYCAADDAFLCQGCDSSVHSANQLASRHERVRLEKGAPNKPVFGSPNKQNSTPAWLKGFTRKARTPRQPKPAKAIYGSAFTNPLAIVPEIGCEEADNSPDEESEEQLLYRVPVFDPFAAELWNAPNNMADALAYEREGTATGGGFAVSMRDKGVVLRDEACDIDTLNGLIIPSDMELAEFAADVESLLGTGLDEDCCGIEGLGLGSGVGLLECNKEEEDDDDDMGNFFVESRKVKVEDDINGVEEVVDCQMEMGFDLERETIAWNFDYEVNGEEEEKMVGGIMDGRSGLKEEEEGEEEEVKRKVILSLNYEGVISAWASQGCPWTDGIRPELNADGGWPDYMGYSHPYGGVGGSHVRGGDDGGREARVSRYREKRRTRLFSKKIRYEVRKLNAEKRPRMKGRFVKRTPFSVPSFPSYLVNTN